MRIKAIKIGDKIDLTVNCVTRNYQIKEIENGMYKIFNKFVISIFVDIDFINKNIVK